MSRSGYSDDYDGWELIRWRGQVASAIRGKRGQAFLRELIEALDALPKHELIANDLRWNGGVCALGAVGAKRGIELEKLDPEDTYQLGAHFGIAHQLVAEIEWVNDEGAPWWADSPAQRWQRMRRWAEDNLTPEMNPL